MCRGYYWLYRRDGWFTQAGQQQTSVSWIQHWPTFVSTQQVLLVYVANSFPLIFIFLKLSSLLIFADLRRLSSNHNVYQYVILDSMVCHWSDESTENDTEKPQRTVKNQAKIRLICVIYQSNVMIDTLWWMTGMLTDKATLWFVKTKKQHPLFWNYQITSSQVRQWTNGAILNCYNTLLCLTKWLDFFLKNKQLEYQTNPCD